MIASAPERLSLAFDCIRRYAEREGWIPIGYRTFTVGPWAITVNGTKELRDGLWPYHALIDHKDIVAMLLLSPFGGSVGGWSAAEGAFIADMEHELAREPR